MTAPVPTLPVLIGSTVHRKWLFQVNTAVTAAGGINTTTPTWTTVGGITNSQFNPDAAVMQDDSDMLSNGAGSQTKTAGNSAFALTFARKTNPDGVTYDTGQEFLRSKAQNTYGPQNSIQMRICEYTPGGGPRVEAYVGYFGVGWENQAGGNTDLDTVNVTGTGQGQCLAVPHPYAYSTAAPVVSAVSPATGLTRTGGTSETITGTGFTGATGVTFGGVAATAVTVVSATQITCTSPAQTAAGAQPVVVTTPNGASNNTVTATYN